MSQQHGNPCQESAIVHNLLEKSLTHVSKAEAFAKEVERLCFRSLCLDARVWFCAPAHELLQHQRELLESRQMEHAWVDFSDWASYLSFASRKRLKECVEFKRNSDIC